MSRKHIVACDRCGFEEETDGVNLKTIFTVSVSVQPLQLHDVQDMCPECREAVRGDLETMLKRRRI